jgi:hypothetical protein
MANYDLIITGRTFIRQQQQQQQQQQQMNRFIGQK